jgi:hypothetical protein
VKNRCTFSFPTMHAGARCRALLDKRELRRREVVLGVVGQHHVDAGVGRKLTEALCRLGIGLEPEAGGRSGVM